MVRRRERQGVVEIRGEANKVVLYASRRSDGRKLVEREGNGLAADWPARAASCTPTEAGPGSLARPTRPLHFHSFRLHSSRPLLHSPLRLAFLPDISLRY